MDELQAGAEAVLQVGELVGEHHRVRAAVSVEDGDGALPVPQHGAGQGQRRRDAGTGDDEDVVAGLGEVCGEGARGRQHLDGVAGPHVVHEVGGEEPAGHLADADPWRRAHRRADGVGAALVPAVHGPAQRERLTRLEPVVLEQVVGDVEGDRDGVVGQLLDLRDRQRVELWPTAGDRGRGLGTGGHRFSCVAPRSFRSSLAGARCDARSLSRH
jgi:hypothetical protein